MAELDTNAFHDDDMPAFHPWLRVLMGAFIPMIVGLYVPQYMYAFFGVAVVIFAIAMVMFVKQERASTRRRRRLTEEVS